MTQPADLARCAPARAQDLAGVVALLGGYGLPTAGVEALLPTFVVTRAGEAVVGCAGLEPYGTAALLRSVAVRADVQGHGVGVRLVREALALATRSGVERVYLLTETASGFFLRLGFRVVARTEVEPAVLGSAEFRSLCPTSATVMRIDLRPAGVQG